MCGIERGERDRHHRNPASIIGFFNKFKGASIKHGGVDQQCQQIQQMDFV